MSKLGILAAFLIAFGLISGLIYPVIVQAVYSQSQYSLGFGAATDESLGFSDATDISLGYGGAGTTDADAMFAVYGETAAPHGVFMAAVPSLFKLASLLGIMIAAFLVFRGRERQGPAIRM